MNKTGPSPTNRRSNGFLRVVFNKIVGPGRLMGETTSMYYQIDKAYITESIETGRLIIRNELSLPVDLSLWKSRPNEPNRPPVICRWSI
jgi:hypothetical protein